MILKRSRWKGRFLRMSFLRQQALLRLRLLRNDFDQNHHPTVELFVGPEVWVEILGYRKRIGLIITLEIIYQRVRKVWEHS